MEFEKLQGILGEILQVDPAEIAMDHSLSAYGADSLMIFQVLMAVEAEFGMEIDNQEGKSWKTVADIWDCLNTEKSAE